MLLGPPGMVSFVGHLHFVGVVLLPSLQGPIWHQDLKGVGRDDLIYSNCGQVGTGPTVHWRTLPPLPPTPPAPGALVLQSQACKGQDFGHCGAVELDPGFIFGE